MAYIQKIGPIIEKPLSRTISKILNEYFQQIFNAKDVQVRKRENKPDSAEIYKGEEFLGVLYDDEGSEEGMQVFNMAILDIDLDDA